jgi:hypothetical protein
MTFWRSHFDNTGSLSVLPKREKDDLVTHRDYRIAAKSDRRWNARRMEVSFDSGSDHENAPTGR